MSKVIRVTMSDGSKWAVPAHAIAHDRAEYYASGDDISEFERHRLYNHEFEYTLAHDDELLDWAVNNMNWSDVSSEAVLVSDPSKLSAKDFQEGWINSDKEVIEQPD